MILVKIWNQNRKSSTINFHLFGRSWSAKLLYIGPHPLPNFQDFNSWVQAIFFSLFGPRWRWISHMWFQILSLLCIASYILHKSYARRKGLSKNDKLGHIWSSLTSTANSSITNSKDWWFFVSHSISRSVSRFGECTAESSIHHLKSILCDNSSCWH